MTDASRLVAAFINNTGGSLPLYTAVELTGTTNNTKVKAVVAFDSDKVIGSVVGYYRATDSALVLADAPDGSAVAVCTAGIARFLIETTVTGLEFAFCAATDGTIYSNATRGAGAFGRIIDTADTAAGHTYARVLFPLAAD